MFSKKIRPGLFGGSEVVATITSLLGTRRHATMGKPDKAAKENKGQSKEHEVRYPDGSTGTMSQKDGKNRDKGAGIERVDEDEGATEPPPSEEPVVPAG